MWHARTVLTVLIGLSAGAGLMLSAALAAESTTPAGDWTAKVLQKHPDADANHDGTLTREEWQQYRQARRAGQNATTADTGKPGKGPGPQGCPFKGEGPGPGMHRPDPERLLKAHPELDTDKDGQLSDEEMMAAREKMPRGMHGGPGGPPPTLDMILKHFDAIDADGNGQLSRQEIQQFKDKCPAMGGWGAGEGGRHGPPEGAPGARLLERHPEADTDKDGKVSPEEFKAFREKNPGAMRQLLLDKHPELDTNKDGQLSDEEFNAMREKHRQDRPGAGRGRGR